MKGRPTKRISLEATQREELERLARQKRKSRSVAFRAQIVLHSAEGRSDLEVAKALRTSNSTVGFWRKRFLEGGVDGLFDEPRVGAPRQIDDEEIEKVV